MRPVLWLTTLLPSCAVVMKSGNLNFLEPSGPLKACNGTALPLPFIRIVFNRIVVVVVVVVIVVVVVVVVMDP